MCGITCEIIQPIFQPILDYMIMACMGNLGLIGIFPKIVDRLCPQCNPIAEILHKICHPYEFTNIFIINSRIKMARIV